MYQGTFIYNLWIGVNLLWDIIIAMFILQKVK